MQVKEQYCPLGAHATLYLEGVAREARAQYPGGASSSSSPVFPHHLRRLRRRLRRTIGSPKIVLPSPIHRSMEEGEDPFLLSQAAKSPQGGKKVCVLSLWVGDGVFFVLASRPLPPESSWSHAQIVSEFAKADPLNIYIRYGAEMYAFPPSLPSSLPFREVDVYSPPGESLGDAREGREGRETAFALNAYEEARRDSFFAIWEVGGGPCVPPCLLLLRS